MTSPTALPLRSDAKRNREQLIAAAARTFVAGGPDVPMEEIARAAGVGVGTLYRRFADRESLMVAVAQTSLDTLLGRVRAAAAEEPRAWDALVRSMSFEGKGALLTRMELVDATGDQTITTFSAVTLRKPFSKAEQTKIFRIGGR